ncbi:MAG: cation transporter [Alphaproteobacteria bacterium]|nr:cation transporter [Alphaproteobacteria bacterium]
MSDHHHSSDDNLKTAFLLNLVFTIIEVIGGVYTNSIAILSDALHDGGDCLSLGASWYFQKKSKEEANPRFTYGYERFSVLGALITGTVLLVGMVVILFRAVPRLMNPEPVHTNGMIALAVLGVVVNGFAAWRASRGSSMNEAVVSWHLLEDVLGWIAVLLGAIAMQIWDIPIIDPLLSIGISIFILVNVARNLWRVAKVFLQHSPEEFEVEVFQKEIGQFEGVSSLHHLHCWSLDGESHVLTLHLLMEADVSREGILRVKRRVKELLSEYPFKHIAMEFELEGEGCCLSESGCKT